ncbi:hypothetical protein SERLADRAFT_434171 [Serpula lacrymans var. lacrymans S7.9]|uniref:Uncharacterized protein n=1 Tax=Serpula lacrymans var. lacrymans (strain S7.9) TaxID=578457 RepID=F8NJQ5_SERL9|nr:uncharacterized protein SERLADRAFT_434171 [Serpula lacrymans var. lacrymans S7.9]EGO28270.1 hypothetical protein SERLADRAFT_434171 [Serpula lacrymans var. lacrymans S7.9]
MYTVNGEQKRITLTKEKKIDYLRSWKWCINPAYHWGTSSMLSRDFYIWIETPPPREASLETYVKQEVEKSIRETRLLYQSQLDEALEEVSVLEKRLKRTKAAPPPERVERTRTALKKPENFSGDKKKYWAFRESLLLHFEDDTAYFKDDRKKIDFVLSFMKEGEAAAFQTNWLENRVDANS